MLDRIVRFIRAHRAAVSVAVALAAALGYTAVVAVDPETNTVTVSVDGPDRNRAPGDVKLKLGEKAKDVAVDAGGVVGPAHGENQRDETPPDSPLAAPGDELQEAPPGSKAREVLRDLKETGQEEIPDDTPAARAPLATGRDPVCATRLVRSYSQRAPGVRVLALALHHTAGPNIMDSLADMNGLTAYSNSSGAVSWHRLLDHDGNCYLSVPLDAKAWTIAALNSATVNYETIGRGNEPTYYGTPAGLATLVAAARHDLTYFGLPIQLGAVSNCTITRPGIITHWMGGFCSGGHVDIRPHDIEAVVRLIQQGAVPQPPPKAERLCREFNKLRVRRAENHGLEPYGRHRVDRLAYYFAARHEDGKVSYTCQPKSKGGGAIVVPPKPIPPPVSAVRRCRQLNMLRRRAAVIDPVSGDPMGLAEDGRERVRSLKRYFAKPHEGGRARYGCKQRTGATRRPA